MYAEDSCHTPYSAFVLETPLIGSSLREKRSIIARCQVLDVAVAVEVEVDQLAS